MAGIVIEGDQLNQAAARWLTKAPSPFFLHVHYMEPHWPYLEHPYQALQWDVRTKWNRDQLVRRYDGEIRFVDQKIEELLAEIERSGLGRNLLVIMTADHGEEFLDHNGWEHSRTLYREVLHVPLILNWPGKLPSGTVVDQDVELVDVAPTIVDLLGEAPVSKWAGRSLVPLVHGDSQPAKPILGNLAIPPRGAARGIVGWRDSIQEGGMKLVLTRKEGAPEQRLLFDVAKDQAERNDLSGSRQELVSKLDSDLNAILAHMEATSVRPGDRTLTPELEEHLKALGYVQ
jgi:arylsulfatase A-like enzyme